MLLRFWGTRGSLATPGPDTVRYGGNTSCVEVRSGNTYVMLDCGTGARGMGARLIQEGCPERIHLLLTHVHWDHIQGFPFFTPVFVPGTELDVYGAAALEQGLAEAVAGQMQNSYFPLNFTQLPARISFQHLSDGSYQLGTLEVRTQHLNHTCPTVGYRLFAGGTSIAYITDHEPFWPHNPDLQISLNDALMHPGDNRHVAFVAGADVLIHDAQYTADEYPSRRGWGHSPMEYVVDVAVAAGVKRLALFHHDPVRSDDALDHLVELARLRARARGGTLDVFAAAEGSTIELQERSGPPAPRAPQLLEPSPTQATLLLVGQVEGRRTIREALVEDGYRFVELEPGIVGASIGELAPELVLLSVDAQESVSRALLSATHLAPGAPIVVIFSEVVSEERLRRVAAAASDVVESPFTALNLRARIRARMAGNRPAKPGPSSSDPDPPVLESLQALDRLPSAELDSLLDGAVACVFSMGEILFRQGDRPTGVYYLGKGRVRLVAHSQEGREITVGFAGAGDTVGEMATLDGLPHSVTAVAVEQVQASYVARDAFVQTLERVPQAAVKLLRLQTRRLREMDQRTVMGPLALAGAATTGQSRAADARMEARIWRLTTLLDLSRALATELDLDQLFELITMRTAVLLKAERTSLFQVDYPNNQLLSRVRQGAHVQEVRIPREEGLVGHVAASGESINLVDAYTDPRFSQDADRESGYHTRSLVCLPLRDLVGRTVGVIQVVNKHDGSFSAEDEDLLRALGTQFSVALGNATLLDASRKETEKSNLLLDVMKALSSELETDALLARIMEKATEVIQAQRSSLFLVDSRTQELWFQVAQGSGLFRRRIPIGVGIAGHVAATGETVSSPDVYADPRFNPDFDSETGFRTRNMLCMPIRGSGGTIVGVLQVLNKNVGAFTWADEDLLAAVASQAAIALQNASLYEEVVNVRNYHQNILSSLPYGVVAVDSQGLVTMVSPAAERLLGSAAGLAVGTECGDLFGAVRNAALWQALRPTLDGSEVGRAETVSFVRPSGEAVRLNVTSVPLLSAPGERVGAILLVDDSSLQQSLGGTTV